MDPDALWPVKIRSGISSVSSETKPRVGAPFRGSEHRDAISRGRHNHFAAPHRTWGEHAAYRALSTHHAKGLAASTAVPGCLCS